MAENTIKETMEEVVEYIGEAVATKENAFRITEMPEPSEDNAGEIYQYIGETDESFTNGYYYECAEYDGTYGWQQIDVQPSRGSGGHTIEDSTGTDMTARTNLQFVGATVTDDSTNDRTVVTVDGGGADSRIGEEITDIKVEKDSGVNRPYIDINPSKVYSKLGDWDSMTDFLKREAKADSSTPQTSTYTAETDEKVLAVCWSKVGSGSDNGDQPVSMTTTGEFASTPLIWKTSDSDEEYKAAGGFGLAQASLSAGESITATSGVRAAADAIFGCFYFLPMTSFATAEIVHTNAIDSHNPHNYTIPSNGHYLCVCTGFGYYVGGGTIQFNDIELNDAVIENQYASSTNTPQFAIAEFVAKQGDTLEASFTSTGNTKSACFLLKLTESGTQETKIELARKDEIVDVDVPSKLTSADIEEIKSQWNPSGGGGGGGGSLIDFSTEEQETGQKWIDGKPLYQKTLVLSLSDFTNASGWYRYHIQGSDMLMVDFAHSFIESTAGTQYLALPYLDTGSGLMGFQLIKDGNGNGGFMFCGNRTSSIASGYVFTVQYTKQS